MFLFSNCSRLSSNGASRIDGIGRQAHSIQTKK